MIFINKLNTLLITLLGIFVNEGKAFKVAILSQAGLITEKYVNNIVTRRVNLNWRILGSQTAVKIDYEIIQISDVEEIQKSVCLKESINFVIVTGECCFINSVTDVTSSMNLPTVALPTEHCDHLSTSGSHVIYQNPKNDYYSAVTSVLQTSKAETVAILHDHQQNQKSVIDVQQRLSQKKMATVTSFIDSSSNTSKSIEEMNKKRIRHFLLLTKPTTALDLLKIAGNLSMLEENYYWTMLDSGMSPKQVLQVLPTVNTMSNILIVRTKTQNILKESMPCQVSVLDAFDTCNTDFIKTNDYLLIKILEDIGSAALKLSQTYGVSQWNFSCKTNNPWTLGAQGMLLLKNLTSYSSNNYLQNKNVEIIGTFTELHNSTTYFTESGYYDVQKDKIVTEFSYKNRKLIFPNTFVGFKHRNIRICSTSIAGMAFQVKTNSDGTVVVEGLANSILEILEKQLDFRSKIYPPPDGQFGAPVPGSPYFTGCIGQLQRENYLIAGPFAVTNQRMTILDYSESIQESGNAMLVNLPAKASKLWNVFAPLDPLIWALLIAMVAVTASVTWFAAKFSPFSAWNLNLNYAISDEVLLKEYLWSVIGSFLQQGQDFYPFAMSPRAVLAFWWLFTVIIFGTYTGDLTAYLTVTKIEYNLQTLEDLEARPHYKALVTKGSNLDTLLQTAPSGLYASVAKQMKYVSSMTECAQTIVAGTSHNNQVCLADLSVLKTFASKYCNEVYLANTVFNPYHVGMTFQKNAYFANEINNVINKLKVSGVLNVLNDLHFPRVGECDIDSISTEADPITLEGVGGAFIMTGAFYVTGGILLLLELLWTRVLKKNPLDLIVF